MSSSNSTPTFVSSTPLHFKSQHPSLGGDIVLRVSPRRPEVRPLRFYTNDPHKRAIYLSVRSDKENKGKQADTSLSSEEENGELNQIRPEPSVRQNSILTSTSSNVVPASDKQSSQLGDSKKKGPLVVDISLGPLKFSFPSRLLLFTVPFMWGSFAPAVRLLYSQEPHQDPSIFNTERLLLSTMIYIPILLAEWKVFANCNTSKTEEIEKDRFSFFPAGIELGVYVFLANVAQVIGLQQTSASRAAFLVQLQTVFVPVIAGVFGKVKIPTITWISSLVAVSGVALLSSDKGHGTVASVYGDALEIVSALFFSTYVYRLEKYCKTVSPNPLVATKIAVQALLSIGWALSVAIGAVVVHAPTSASENGVPWTLGTVAVTAAIVAWTGLVSSALSGWAQTKGQQGASASEAVVIFATQPLWASAIAVLLLGESFGPRGVVGGGLIIAATLLSSKKSNADEEKGKEA